MTPTAATTPTATMTPDAAAATPLTTATASHVANVPLALQYLPSLSYLPPQIWSASWVPRSGRYCGFFLAGLLAETVYDIVVDVVVPLPKFELRGKDVEDLVVLFKDLLAQAAVQGDFTENYLPNARSLCELLNNYTVINTKLTFG